MRDEDQEILEEAIRNSAAGEDFDEMLLRATKKHLPRRYHKQFTVILEEVVMEADERCLSNRQAAQNLLKGCASKETQKRTGHAGLPPVISGPLASTGEPRPTPVGADFPEDMLMKHLHQSELGARPEPGTQTMPPAERKHPVEAPQIKKGASGDAAGPPENAERAGGAEKTEGPVEMLPETEKIVDLGGTHPESLPPELKDKLKKLVKAQKKKQSWDEKPAEEDAVPGLFFKGQQRAPPVISPRKPVRTEEATPGHAGGEKNKDDEEDLEAPERSKVKVKTIKR